MSDQSAAAAASMSTRFYRAAWRWHFYAGLYVAPFMIMLAVTGLMILWVNVFDGRDGQKGFSVTPQNQTLPVSDLSSAAAAAVPDGAVVQYIAPRTETQVALFRVNTETDSLMVAVNPYSAEVLDSWSRRSGWYDLAKNIHGTLLIGDLGDRLIEIAAGFGLVLIATGAYLWWPREQSLGRALVPDFKARGRQWWKSLHASIGFHSAIILVVFLLSGLAWAGIWGGKFVQPWSTFPAEKWSNVPLSDATHASMNHGVAKDVPWGLEQTPMPASGSDAGSEELMASQPVTADSVADLARALGMEGRFQMNFPKGETGVWTISQDSMSNDTSDPFSDRTVHVDQYTGKLLAEARFADYSPGAKAMAVGIAFHEGDMGGWNIVLNTVFCLAIIFLSASGLVMWWKRRPSTSGLRLFAPPEMPETPFWSGAVLIMLFLSLAFPLVGLTLLAVLALDVLVLSNIRPLKRVFQ